MAHPAEASRPGPLNREHTLRLGQQMLTALLREDIEGLDRTPVWHPLTGWSVHQPPYWIPVEPDGLWHPHRAATGEVWDGQNLRWAGALEVLKALDLPHFDLLLQEHEAALRYSAYRSNSSPALLKRLKGAPCTGHHGHLFYDRLAALLDHPIYPLPARMGLQDRDLNLYCPESSDGFELHWVALDAAEVQLHGTLPAFFPDGETVGLPDLPGQVLLPLHPHSLNWARQQGLRVAPRTHLKVHPTLSLRTLVLEEHPEVHLKLPLQVSTLGFKNRRTLNARFLQDGARLQQVLPHLTGKEVHFTDESIYGCTRWPELAFMVRRYPTVSEHTQMVGLAGLVAPHPQGKTVLEHLSPDPQGFLRQVVKRLLKVHLQLALEHGVVLEAHQQNTTLLVEGEKLELLLRDNDSPRIHWPHFSQQHPELARQLLPFGDERIQTDRTDVLCDMFITIVLHLCLTSVLKQAADRGLLDLNAELQFVRSCVEQQLDWHAGSPFAATFRKRLLEDDHYPSKRMWSAGTLYPKAQMGASDINKCYRHHAPNYLKHPPGEGT